VRWDEAFKAVGKTAERHPHAGVFIGLCLLGSVVTVTTHAAWAAVAVSLGLGGLYSMVIMVSQRHAAAAEERAADSEATARRKRRKAVAAKLGQATLPLDGIAPAKQKQPDPQ
jgi:hypothetical protein